MTESLNYMQLITGSSNIARKTQILLPNEEWLEILVQPRLLVVELQDIVSSHFNLKDKKYFGLSYRDDTGHWLWLQPTHRVLDHDFPKQSLNLLQLRFGVKFYLEQIDLLQDSNAVELFYLQSQQLIFSGDLECDGESVFHLAAFVLQVNHGDYQNDCLSCEQLKKLKVFPMKVLKQHLSLEFCEIRVILYYRDMVGYQRGDAIFEYLAMVQKLPTYGMHLYEVKDKTGIPWWLAIGFRGIYQFDYNDKRIPRKFFSWHQLQNLYYRDKKFSIEMHEWKRVSHTVPVGASNLNSSSADGLNSLTQDDGLTAAFGDPTTQVSVSRRTFTAGNVNVYAWWAATSRLTKALWCAAVAQHQFYMEQQSAVSKGSESGSSSSQSSSMPHLFTGAEVSYAAEQRRSELVFELTHRRHSFTKLPSQDLRVRVLAAQSQSGSLASSSSLNGAEGESSREDSLVDLHLSPADMRRRYEHLKARKESRRLLLQEKLKRLKQVCIEEAELTGQLPPEFPRHDGEPLPTFRRRVRTTYTINPQLLFSGGESSSVGADCAASDSSRCKSSRYRGAGGALLAAIDLEDVQTCEESQVRSLQLELQVLRNKAAALRRMHASARSRRHKKSTLMELQICEERVSALERQLGALRNNPLLRNLSSSTHLSSAQRLYHTVGATAIKRLSATSSVVELRRADSGSLSSDLSADMPLPTSNTVHHTAAVASGVGYISFQPARGYRADAFPTLIIGAKVTRAAPAAASTTTPGTTISSQSADSGFIEGFTSFSTLSTPTRRIIRSSSLERQGSLVPVLSTPVDPSSSLCFMYGRRSVSHSNLLDDGDVDGTSSSNPDDPVVKSGSQQHSSSGGSAFNRMSINLYPRQSNFDSATYRYLPRQLEYTACDSSALRNSQASTASSSTSGELGSHWYVPHQLERENVPQLQQLSLLDSPESDRYRSELKAKSQRLLTQSPKCFGSPGLGGAQADYAVSMPTTYEKSFDSADAMWYSERARAQRIAHEQQAAAAADMNESYFLLRRFRNTSSLPSTSSMHSCDYQTCNISRATLSHSPAGSDSRIYQRVKKDIGQEMNQWFRGDEGRDERNTGRNVSGSASFV